MNKLLIATHNIAKLNDFKELLKNYPWQLVSLDDLNIKQIAEEQATSFEENSLQKAKFYAHLSGLLTLADDSGLEIPYLGNFPGVKTRRWETDEPLDDNQLVNKILEKMSGLTGKDRLAKLKTVITVYNPSNQNYLQAEGEIVGEIATQLAKQTLPGYPIRSIFFVSKVGKYYIEFTKADRTKFNHRGEAIKKLIPKINTL